MGHACILPIIRKEINSMGFTCLLPERVSFGYYLHFLMQAPWGRGNDLNLQITGKNKIRICCHFYLGGARGGIV